MLASLQGLPQLNTVCNESLLFLERHFLANREQVEAWFALQWEKTPPPVYGSVDLRNAGFKLAPIDMNLFPAGFNNLNPAFLSASVQAAEKVIKQRVPGARRILVIPESHTRNLRYWENVATLQKILEGAGLQVRFGMLGEEVKEALDIVLASGQVVKVEPLLREGKKLHVTDFEPDIVLLNNDLADGIPEILQNLNQHALVPPAELGWSQRLKSEHFQYYAEVTQAFSEQLGIDPWLIAPLFKYCGQIDFMEQDGMTCLLANAEILFEQIKEKYAAYHIPYQPFLIVKADAGTYGMAVMTVRSLDELKNMNRKQRTHMSMTKGKQPVRRVIIQEGVYTFETLGESQAVAEPVVYLWGQRVVGGFYRVHQERGVDENLNAPGMQFESLAFPQPCDQPCQDVSPDASQNRFYVYGVVAQLSMLAAAREMSDQIKGAL